MFVESQYTQTQVSQDDSPDPELTRRVYNIIKVSARVRVCYELFRGKKPEILIDSSSDSPFTLIVSVNTDLMLR